MEYVPFIVPRARCQVATIVVTEKYRSKGIGQKLMSAFPKNSFSNWSLSSSVLDEELPSIVVCN